MEHDELFDWIASMGLKIDKKMITQLMEYVDILYTANKSINLTGADSKEEIINNLIIKSIEPLICHDVPRGTSFIDLGTGQGIPGIPICILNPHKQGTLIDANRKKIEFITYVSQQLRINNLIPIVGRAEELSRMKTHREKYDFCISRAFAGVYAVLELASPFIAMNGYGFIYSHISPDDLSDDLIAHGLRVGLGIENDEISSNRINHGLLFKKISSCEPKYPRRFAVIKRESKRIEC